MGEVITKEYSKGCEVEVVTTLIPQSAIMAVYLHFAQDPRQASTSYTKEIMVKNVTIDERMMATTGKQFASADLVRLEDDTTSLLIPSVEYNLFASCSLTEDDVECDDACSTESELQKAAKKKEVRAQAEMYMQTLNRNAQIGMKVLRDGVLEAHNSTFTFGTGHVYATTATEKYADASFDVMDFIGDQLDKGSFTKVTISHQDIKAFKNAIQSCGDNNCTTKGFIPHKQTDGASIIEKGVMLLGYHEDTMTPIYAAAASVVDNVRDETTGKVTKVEVKLIPKGMMLFTNGTPINHKFGALQMEQNGVSRPRRMKFRQFKNIDKDTQLVTGRFQTNLTPYVASFTNVLVVDGLS